MTFWRFTLAAGRGYLLLPNRSAQISDAAAEQTRALCGGDTRLSAGKAAAIARLPDDVQKINRGL